jgi:hypothetical protein
MTLTVKTLALGMLALALGAVAACAPEKPAAPTYAKDVGPILDAHCSRCHSASGPDGGLQGDPGKAHPASCKFDFYDSNDTSTCSVADGGGAPPMSCWGAHYCATKPPFSVVLPGYIRGEIDPMPPPPASLLNDWELDVVLRWIDSGAPER